MAPGDLGFVVREHLHHFPRGFFARLGPRFLREYYRAFLTGPASLTVVAERGGRPVGYLVGVTDPARHREHVVRSHGRALALRATTGLLARPRLGWCFLRTRAARYVTRLLRGRRGESGPAPSSPPAVLTHVAVTPPAHGHGIGSRLVGWFEDEVADRGCDRIVLVTASDKEGAGRFYEGRRWRRTGEHSTPDGHRLSTYELEVGTSPDGTGAVAQA